MPAYAGDDGHYIAVKSFSSNIFGEITYIGSNGVSIVSAETRDVLFGVIVPRDDDWNEWRPMIILAGATSGTYYYPPPTQTNEWDVTDLRGDAGQSVAVFKSPTTRAKYLTFAELEIASPTALSYIPSNGYEMYKRSRSFNGQSTLGAGVSNLPSELKEAIIRLLEAAVNRNIPAALSLILGDVGVRIAGRVGAVALGADFQFVSYKSDGLGSYTLFSEESARRFGSSSGPQRMAFRFVNTRGTGWQLESLTASATSG